MAARWLRATRGTLAAVLALTKNKPGRLLASTLDPDASKHRLYLEIAGALRGLAWQDEITAGGTSGGSSGNLITTPVITAPASVSSSGAATFSVTAAASPLLVNVTIARYEWAVNGAALPDTGATVAVNKAAAGASVTIRCRAVDSVGNSSAWAEKTVSTSPNAAPDATSVALVAVSTGAYPTTLKRSTTYALKISGGADAEDLYPADYAFRNVTGALVANVQKTALASSSAQATFDLSVSAGVTLVKFDVVVIDALGAESSPKSFLWDGTNLQDAGGTSGVMTSGTYTVVVPAGQYSIRGNGGLGSMHVGTGCCCVTDCNDAGCVTYNCDDDVYYAGAKTTVKAGATTIQTFNGSAATSSGYKVLPALSTVVKTAATQTTLTVSVAASGGTCEIFWE